MKRSWIAFATLALLAVLLGGCVTRSFAGQDNNAAPGATPGAGQVAAGWERHRFFDVWDVAYPTGWTVDRPGTGDVLLSGAYGAHQYQVAVTRPTGVTAQSLAAWVQSDLEAINQGGAPRQPLGNETLPALKVTNLNLPGQAQGACPAVRVYARTNNARGEQNYLVMTVTQTDKTACDAAASEQLAEALIAAVRS